MAIEVTENWSQARLSLRVPWTAYREFVVTGTSDETAALTATGIPQKGEGHAYNPTRLICDGPEIRGRKFINGVGAGWFLIGSTYTFSDTGDTEDTPADPLLEPAVIDWEHVEVLEPVDRDLGKRPILMPNGLVPTFQVSRPIVYKKFKILKNFPFYDLNVSKAYDNSVNDAPIALGLGLNAVTGHLRCVSIIPATSYKATAAFVPMAFTFELISDGTLGEHPFQHRLMSQGREGWLDDGGTKRHLPFTQLDPSDGKYREVASEIRLKLDGTPFSPTFSAVKVGPGGATPVAYPQNPIATHDTETLADAAWVYYQKTRIVDMSPLIALL